MDAYKIKPLNSSLKQKSDSNSTTQKKNAIINPTRKPRLKDILSSNNKPDPPVKTPKRYSSPNTPRNSTTLSLPKRPHSAERRPSSPQTPVPDTSAEVRTSVRRAPPESLWPSMRNLSSSFQLESVPKKASSSNKLEASSSERLERKSLTPIKQSENSNLTPQSKIIDQHRWPAMKGGTISSISSINMSKSMDLTDKINRGAFSSFIKPRGVSPKKAPVTKSTENSTSVSSKLLVSQLSPSAMSKSVDLMDKSKRPVSRGNSPRRTVSGDSTNFKAKQPVSRSASPVQTGTNTSGNLNPNSIRGASPVRTGTSGTLNPNFNIRGASPVRTGTNVTLNPNPIRGASPVRTGTSGTLNPNPIRGASPVRKSTSGTLNPNFIRGASSPMRTSHSSDSTDFKDKIKRPASMARTSISTSGNINPSFNTRGTSPIKTTPTPNSNSSSNSSEVALNEPSKLRPPSRGLSVRRKLINEISSNSLSKSMDLGEKLKKPVPQIKRPASSSGRPLKNGSNGSLETGQMGQIRSQSLTRASRTVSSPLTGFGSNSKRAIQSPLRGRPNTACSNSTTSSSSSSGGSYRGSFASSSNCNYGNINSNNNSDVRKGRKKGSVNKMEDLVQLKLLNNRDLQWKFVNACLEDVHSSQKLISEGMLSGMWSDLSMLRDSVAIKRLEMQELRQETKLEILLNDQIEYLDSWASVEREHCSLLSDAIAALKAATLRLPVTGGAKADVLTVRNAVSSAIDIMQAMGSSISLLLPKAENANSLVEELALISSKERALLDQGRELVGTIAKLHVQETSLKTQLIQLKQDGLKEQTEGTVLNSEI